MRRVVLGLQYDGGPWQGWQTQSSGLTIQDRLESALRKFTGHDLATHCAGRTDAGVHALEQVVHFDCDIERDLFSWVRGVNAFLPSSIAVRWAKEVEAKKVDGFHARFSARGRIYRYVLYNHPVRAPLLIGRTGWVFRRIDVDQLQKGADHLLGTHDFSAFRAVECQAKTAVKSLYSIDVTRNEDLITLTFHANAFLHHMVRNMVGSLIYVGVGKRPPEWIAEILQGGDRSLAAPTFSPDGLYLAKIDYDPKWNLPALHVSTGLWG